MRRKWQKLLTARHCHQAKVTTLSSAPWLLIITSAISSQRKKKQSMNESLVFRQDCLKLNDSAGLQSQCHTVNTPVPVATDWFLTATQFPLIVEVCITNYCGWSEKWTASKGNSLSTQRDICAHTRQIMDWKGFILKDKTRCRVLTSQPWQRAAAFIS